MNYERYLTLVGEAMKCSTEESWIGEFGYPTETNLTTEQLISTLKIIYKVAKGSFKELQELSKINQSQFAKKFNIPLRTLQDWIAERRLLPSYVKQFIGYILVQECMSDYNK